MSEVKQATLKSSVGSLQRLTVAVFWFLLANLLFLRYFKPIVPFLGPFLSFRGLIDWILLLTVVVSWQRHGMRSEVRRLSIFAFAVLILSLGVNALMFGVNAAFMANILEALLPLSVPLFLFTLSRELDRPQIEVLLRRTRKLLNWYFFFNSFLVIIQIRTETFMMGRFLEVNPAPIDHMSGLIGLNGVGTLNFVWMATLVLNARAWAVSRRGRGFVLIVLQFAVMIALSGPIDNKMISVTLIAFLITSVVAFGDPRPSLTATYLSVCVVTAPIVIFLAMHLIRLPESIMSTLQMFFYNSSEVPDSHVERAVLNYRAFTEFHAWGLGVGVSRVDMATQTIHRHLGINSSTLVLIQGGVLLLGAYLLVYAAAFLRLFIWRGKNALLVATLVGTFVVASYASEPLGDQYVMIALGLAYLAWANPVVRSTERRKMPAQRRVGVHQRIDPFRSAHQEKSLHPSWLANGW